MHKYIIMYTSAIHSLINKTNRFTTSQQLHKNTVIQMLYLSPICKEIALSNCTESYCISTNTKIYRLTATIETQECSTTTCISFSTEASCMTFINQFNTIILVFKTSTLQHMATWQFHKSDKQDTEEEVSLCLVRGCGTHYHWLSVMYH